MAKNTHLTLDERIEIEAALNERKSFKMIARDLGKDPTTISKEVRNHLIPERPNLYNPCVHYPKCRKHSNHPDRGPCTNCNKHFQYCRTCGKCISCCSEYEPLVCLKVDKPPYVCNGCLTRRSCHLDHKFYRAKHAQEEYEVVRSESREGISVSPEELERIDAIISPLIKKGQSLHHICATHADELMLDERTLYNYFESNLFSAGNLDLPRKVRYKPRKKEKSVLRVDKKCFQRRTYEDFNIYITAFPDTAVVEMDSVIGKKGGKVLLTLFFRNCEFMLAYIRDANTARSVADIHNDLYDTLGHDVYCKLFPVILTDRGSEFTDPNAIELNSEGELRTHIFYCDPQRSDQKAGIEVTHEFIRRILPKGTSFDNLDQADIDLMMSHINSYKRKKLNDRSAHQLFNFYYGEDVLNKLNATLISADDIILKPSLLKK